MFLTLAPTKNSTIYTITKCVPVHRSPVYETDKIFFRVPDVSYMATSSSLFYGRVYPILKITRCLETNVTDGLSIPPVDKLQDKTYKSKLTTVN